MTLLSPDDVAPVKRDLDATLAAAWFNNNECVFMVEDMNHRYRVVGNEHYPMKVSVTQDTGMGITGNAATTITVEASDDVPAPFYHSKRLFSTGEDTAAMYASEEWNGPVEQL